jgi:hypothetical protein
MDVWPLEAAEHGSKRSRHSTRGLPRVANIFQQLTRVQYEVCHLPRPDVGVQRAA